MRTRIITLIAVAFALAGCDIVEQVDTYLPAEAPAPIDSSCAGVVNEYGDCKVDLPAPPPTDPPADVKCECPDAGTAPAPPDIKTP
jgi:hypothetical protein